MKTLKFILILLYLSFVSQSAFAQQNEDVSSELTAFKITMNESGDEVATEVDEVRPGDLIEYRLTYTNNTAESITNLVPTLPIPSSMYYMAETASPEIERASYLSSGNNFQVPPLTREATTSGGLRTTREVSPKEYSRLQWTIDTLEGGDSATLIARVRVSQQRASAKQSKF